MNGGKKKKKERLETAKVLTSQVNISYRDKGRKPPAEKKKLIQLNTHSKVMFDTRRDAGNELQKND